MSEPIPTPDFRAKLIRLEVRVEALEKESEKATDERRQLLDFMAGTKMLQSLSLGGGFLSVINIVILLAQLAASLIP